MSSVEPTTCAVCHLSTPVLEPLHDGIHFFHRACVQPWLEVKGTCPLCRKQVCEVRVSEASAETLAVIAEFNRIFGGRFEAVAEPAAPAVNINALAELVTAGNQAGFEAWLNGNELTNEIRNAALRAAAVAADSHFLSRLLDINVLTVAVRSELLVLAAAGHEENALIILGNGTVTGAARAQAALAATTHGLNDLASLILD